MAPPRTVVTTWSCSLILIYRPRKGEKLSWPSWLTYSGRFTHISGHPSAVGQAQDSESAPVIKDQRSTAEPRKQLNGLNESNESDAPRWPVCDVTHDWSRHRDVSVTLAHALAHVDFTLNGKLAYRTIRNYEMSDWLTMKLLGLFRKPGLHVRKLRNKTLSCRREAVRVCYQQLALTMQYFERITVFLSLVIVASDLQTCTNKFRFVWLSTDIGINKVNARCMLSTYSRRSQFADNTRHSTSHPKSRYWSNVEFYLYPTVSTALIQSVKPELTK